jgi:hypothetical protein
MVVENRAFRKDKLAKQPVVDVARRRGWSIVHACIDAWMQMRCHLVWRYELCGWYWYVVNIYRGSPITKLRMLYSYQYQNSFRNHDPSYSRMKPLQSDNPSQIPERPRLERTPVQNCNYGASSPHLFNLQ